MNVFEVLAHPIRHRIVTILASGEHTSGNLVDVISHEHRVTKAAVSWHLAVLRDSGYVIVRQEYTERWYRLDEDVIRRLRKEVRTIVKVWRRRIGDVDGTDPLAAFSRKRIQKARRTAGDTSRVGAMYTQGVI
ncbi:transcriptional regulator [Glaciihabitans arcticus]|uniref:Transcriptional regulator n=1 Tax=Glaciihabitans arcticus TaxID=2668039 RepID=A0A4Q9GTK6_9MICO|nr:metalloregulator ArsR/SmtB family transcription factor [Glaciihabitans arcticus]TBN57504.1 transcriptional regulator [Glaciihabitans arcticus]